MSISEASTSSWNSNLPSVFPFGNTNSDPLLSPYVAAPERAPSPDSVEKHTLRVGNSTLGYTFVVRGPKHAPTALEVISQGNSARVTMNTYDFDEGVEEVMGWNTYITNSDSHSAAVRKNTKKQFQQQFKDWISQFKPEQKGGFYPSIMTGVEKVTLLAPVALRMGYSLYSDASRRGFGRRRGPTRRSRKSKPTRRRRANRK
jgi:hypothetical protein